MIKSFIMLFNLRLVISDSIMNYDIFKSNNITSAFDLAKIHQKEDKLDSQNIKSISFLRQFSFFIVHNYPFSTL